MNDARPRLETPRPVSGPSAVTAIVTAYRRPHAIDPLVRAIRAQSVPVASLWGWANEPTEAMNEALRQSRLDRLVTSSENTFFHGRFTLALLAQTPFVAIFDDDTVPGPEWIGNCLRTLAQLESAGISAMLGAAGVRLRSAGYHERTMHGWQQPCDEPVEVDLVGQAWFLRTEHVRYLFAERPVTGTNGEDIELSARAWRLAGVRSFCPPHPAGNVNLWGSTRGMELGTDEAASSHRVQHEGERDHIVRAEMAAGWKPLFMRRDAGVRSLGLGASDTTGNGTTNGEAGGEGRRVAVAMQGASNGEANGEHLSAGCQGLPLSPFPSLTTPHAPLPIPAGREETLVLNGEAREVDGLAAALDGQTWQRIDCGRALVGNAAPERLIGVLREHLAPDGALLMRIPNARHFERIGALLRGEWSDIPKQGTLNANDAMLRHFTRRELEKLLFRSGFGPPRFEPEPNPALTHWREQGTPSRVDMGMISATLDSPNEAEDLLVEEYRVAASPVPQPVRPLTSIVILTWNQVGYTQRCLQSILQLTDEPYELVLVDNGSTDGTPEYLRALTERLAQSSPNAPQLRLIVNPQNLGFPVAANQGIAASQGEQILLLNNDVVVTTGWLAHMLDALDSDPRIGLVGPCSNCVSGPQEVPSAYSDLASLDGFAWESGKKHTGVREDTSRLVGFCLLARRSLIEQIGVFDERFGMGNFEDDDLCRRAIQAGWRCVIARDAYIHHFGNKSFAGSGIDLHSLLLENQAKFEEKWAGSVDEGAGTLDREDTSVDREAWTVDRADNQAIAAPPVIRQDVAPHSSSDVTTVPRFIAPPSDLPLSYSPPLPNASSVVPHPPPPATRHFPGTVALHDRPEQRAHDRRVHHERPALGGGNDRGRYG